MKSSILFLSVLFSLSCVIVFAQTKHALVFAIGNYPKAGGWPQISSVRDVSYIRSTLLRQGFQENNIKTVVDANATVKGISDALSDLIGNVKAGDIAVIHFSTHGEQVEDDNGDETDGKDESIVTYNAVAPKGRADSDFKKHQADYFRDDRFGFYINQLRNKLGKNGDIIVFMDLCHSGSGTRGIAKVRGGQPPLVSSTFEHNKPDTPDTSGLFKENNIQEAGEGGSANYVVFSASRAEELDYEITDNNIEMGSLTYAISKAFEKLEKGTTYRALFAKIQSIINDKLPNQQHPVLEGNGIDRELFGGRFIEQKPYVEIEKINGKQLIIRAGKLSGLDSGAKVSVHPSGTHDPATAVAISSGTVIGSNNYSSTVNLDKAGIIRQAADAWVFVSEPVYKVEPVRIQIISGNTRSSTKSFSEAESSSIKNGLKDLAVIRFDGEPDLLIVKGETADSIKIAANGYVFKTINNAGSNPGALKEEIRNYVQYKFLQGIEIDDANTKLEVKLVPVMNNIADTAMISSKFVQGTYEYTEGEKFVLWVKNNGKKPVYFNVLDIQPDGIINPVFPFKDNNIYPRDLKIEAGSSHMFEKYILTVSPPFGTEIFKVFASTKEIDMEGITTTRGSVSRGDFSILERLVKNSYDMATRGISTENISNADGSTYNILFRIKPGSN